MNIDTRLRALEEAKSRHVGVLMFVIADSSPTPEQAEAIQAAQAAGRPLLVLGGSDVDG